MKRLKLLAVGLTLLGFLLGGVRPAAADISGVNIKHSPYLMLGTEDNWKWSPVVAYDPHHDQYLVVWEGDDNTGGLGS